MSNSLSILLFVLVAAAIRSTNANIQEWGFEDQNTQMAYEYIERQPKGIKRVELNFPYFATHERKNLFAFIRVTDLNEYEEGATAKITFGGIGLNYVGITLESENGVINSRIEIFEYIDESIEE